MAIEIEGRRYETVIGTDVSRSDGRNGAYIEMYDRNTPHEVALLIAFRSNVTGKITVSMYRQDVPLEVLNYFLGVASEELSTERWPLWEEET